MEVPDEPMTDTGEMMEVPDEPMTRIGEVPIDDAGEIVEVQDEETDEPMIRSGEVTIDDAGEMDGQNQVHVKYKRNYFWCPVADCTSGPVQKITQHLQKLHKMDSPTAARVAQKKRRAPLEAVTMKIPNPHTRSSGLQHLGHFVSKMRSQTKKTTAPSSSHIVPPPPAEASTSGVSTGDYHQGGEFLDGLKVHLMDRAGRNRGQNSATQITRYVGKYMHYINNETLDERDLLKTEYVLPYLKITERAAIGCSGILHRILAHKAAVQYLRLAVSYLISCILKL